MLELSNAQIGGWVGQFLLPLFRIAALLMSMPLIGTQLVPMRVRLYLALAIALVLVPTLPAMPMVDSLSLEALLLIAEQLLIGVMLGFVLQLFFHVFIVSGQLLAMQMQLLPVGMVKPENVFNTASRLTQAMGFRSPEEFWTDPSKQPPQPPPPDPRIEAEKIKAQATLQVKGAEMQAQAADDQRQFQIEQQRLQAEMQAEQAKVQMQAELERYKAELDAQLEREKAAMQRETQLQIARMNAHTQRQANLGGVKVKRNARHN